VVLQSQPGHLQTQFSLVQENALLQSSHSASLGQLPLLTAAKIAVTAAEATTHIIYASDALANKKALFPFSCFFHLPGYRLHTSKDVYNLFFFKCIPHCKENGGIAGYLT